MSMGATWNGSLVNAIGKVVAHEALAKHWGDHSNALGFFAPNINIVRSLNLCGFPQISTPIYRCSSAAMGNGCRLPSLVPFMLFNEPTCRYPFS
jgi:hypothetical protein